MKIDQPATSGWSIFFVRPVLSLLGQTGEALLSNRLVNNNRRRIG